MRTNPSLISRLLCAGITLAVLGSNCPLAMAQQPPCTVVGNVAKLGMPFFIQPSAPGGKYYQAVVVVPEPRLPPEAFAAHEGLFHHVPILSVERNDGPRRIVLARTFTENWRTDGTHATPSPPSDLMAILSVARPEDSFALLVIGGPHVVVPFGSSREALRATVEALAKPDLKGIEGPDLFDGLTEATKLFGSPQIGDSILELGDVRRWRWDKRKAHELRTAMVIRGIRLFSLGGAYATTGGDPGELGSTGSSPLLNLCFATGGGWESIGYLDAEADKKMPVEWEAAAKRLYDLTTSAYVFRLPKTGPHVQIELTAAASNLDGYPQLWYPYPLPVCPPPHSAATVAGDHSK